jgi:hypothetical protein
MSTRTTVVLAGVAALPLVAVPLVAGPVVEVPLVAVLGVELVAAALVVEPPTEGLVVHALRASAPARVTAVKATGRVTASPGNGVGDRTTL